MPKLYYLNLSKILARGIQQQEVGLGGAFNSRGSPEWQAKCSTLYF